jgi:hypothetical protein
VECVGRGTISNSDNCEMLPTSKLGLEDDFDGNASGYLDKPIAEGVGKECESSAAPIGGLCRTDPRWGSASGGEDGGEDCCESGDRSPKSESEALAVDMERSGLGCRILWASASDDFAFPGQPFRIPFDLPMLPVAEG